MPTDTTLPAKSDASTLLGNIHFEELVDGTLVATSKLHTGAAGTDGGPVAQANPLFVELSDGTNPVGTTGNPLVANINAALPAGTNVIGHVINDAGTAVIGKVGIDQTTPGTTNGVQVNAALPVGTNVVGKVGIDQTTPGTTNKVNIGNDGIVDAAGTKVTAATIPTGGVGFLGWLSGIWYQLTQLLSINVTQVGGTATDTNSGVKSAGTLRVVLATDQPQLTNKLLVTPDALPAGTAVIGKVGIDQTTPGTTNGVQVNAALPAGTNLLGKVGIDQTTPGTTNGVQVNAALPAGTNLLGKTGIDQTTPGTTNNVVVSDTSGNHQPAGDVAARAIHTQAAAGQDNQVVYYNGVAYTPSFALIDTSASGDVTVIAAVVSKSIIVLDFSVEGVGTATSVYFKDGAGTAVRWSATRPFVLDKTGTTGPGGYSSGYSPLGKMKPTAAGQGLVMNNLNAQGVTGILVYIAV